MIPDDEWAKRTIFMEAQGEPYPAKLGVAEVIRNRSAQHYNSDGTVVGTVLWPLQFSGWNAVGSYRIRACQAFDDAPAMGDCLRAWQDALAGSVSVPGALLFHSVPIATPPVWATDDRFIAQLGRIKFFTK